MLSAQGGASTYARDNAMSPFYIELTTTAADWERGK